MCCPHACNSPAILLQFFPPLNSFYQRSEVPTPQLPTPAENEVDSRSDLLSSRQRRSSTEIHFDRSGFTGFLASGGGRGVGSHGAPRGPRGGGGGNSRSQKRGAGRPRTEDTRTPWPFSPIRKKMCPMSCRLQGDSRHRTQSSRFLLSPVG